MSQPPPLCHQRSSDGCLYRTFHLRSADAYDDEEEFPVWRSRALPLGRRRARGVLPRPRRRRLVRRGAAGLPRPGAGDGRDTPHALAHAQLAGRQPALQHRRPAVRPLAPRAPPPAAPRPSAPAPSARRGPTPRAPRTLRRVRVPPTPDALLRAVEQAEAGDTLELPPGQHLLSRELSIEKPLRLHAATAAPRAAVCRRRRLLLCRRLLLRRRRLLLRRRRRARRRPPRAARAVATFHILLRVRHAAVLDGLWMCRMGDEVGYPNAVVFAEGGKLQMQTAATCGGGAPTRRRPPRSPTRPPARVAGGPGGGGGERRVERGARGPGPAGGLWVGAAASVTLSHCRIFACLGPGIKIYRGALVATHNTVGFSRRGANVVANGGAVVLKHNEIVGALGDGVSSWNNSQLVVESNRIHANAGAGIAINSGGAPPSPPLFRHCRHFRCRHPIPPPPRCTRCPPNSQPPARSAQVARWRSPKTCLRECRVGRALRDLADEAGDAPAQRL